MSLPIAYKLESSSEHDALAEPVLLSQCRLWQAQRDFFGQYGAEVWKQDLVPRYITSNPFIAHAYARIVLAYLRDHCAEVSATETEGASGGGPLYIIELGAGSGQFSYYFLKEFLPAYEAEIRAIQEIRYVMTDISRKTVDHWQSHEQLQGSIQKGVLDFACFDACKDEVLQLQISGTNVGRGNSSGPFIVIANYFFDCLPHDVFEVRDGRLYECLVTIQGDLEDFQAQASGEDEEFEIDFHSRPCVDAYYSIESWNDVLQRYCEAEQDGYFLFPVGALQCFDNLRALSQGKLFLLSGDKGHHQFESTRTPAKPTWGTHGRCFSFAVNYFALSECARHKGADVWHPPNNPKKINVLAFLFGARSHSVDRANQAYRQFVGEFGPDDFFTLKRMAEGTRAQMSLAEITTVMRLSRHDAVLLSLFYERLMEVLSQATAAEKDEFYSELQAVAKGCFILNGAQSPAFELGTLLAAIERYEEALGYYQRSQVEAENSASTEFNLGLTHLILGNLNEACECLTNALALESEFIGATQLLNKIDRWSRVRISKEADDRRWQDNLDTLEKNAFVEAQLQDPQVWLEPLLPSHASALFAHATPEIMRRTRRPTFSSRGDAVSWIRHTSVDPENYTFAITDQTLGFVGVLSMKTVDKAGQFFFWLGEPFWGRGLATAAMCRLLRFALDELCLEELQTVVLADNQPSMRVLEKLGFRCLNSPDKELRAFWCGLPQPACDDITNMSSGSSQYRSI